MIDGPFKVICVVNSAFETVLRSIPTDFSLLSLQGLTTNLSSTFVNFRQNWKISYCLLCVLPSKTYLPGHKEIKHQSALKPILVLLLKFTLSLSPKVAGWGKKSSFKLVFDVF